MRVRIDHHDEAAGLIGTNRRYLVDCSVEFSDEEKAVIQTRGLRNHFVDLPDNVIVAAHVEDVRRGYMRKLLIAAGVCLLGLIVAPLTARGGTPVGPLMFFGGGGYAIYALYKFLVPPRTKLDRVRLNFLLSHRRFVAEATSPAMSKAMEADIQGSLEALKRFLDGSAELGTGRTVEL